MAKNSTKNGIGYSPLTERVYLGSQNKEKGLWVGEKEDITSDFINVMFDYVPENTTRSIRSSKSLNIFINVKSDQASIRKTIKWLEKQIQSA